MINTVYNEDCMVGMARYPDKYFDLAIVDPPYGIGEDGKKNHSRAGMANPKLYAPKEWDRQKPERKYFDELVRVSKNQIVWGANHFISQVPIDSSCWIVWDKQNGENDFADCELALTTFDSAVRKFVFRWAGMLQGDMKNKETRIHPTQKPVALYDWIIANYANQNATILDTHVGSGSLRIAADRAGLDFIGFEIDRDYWEGQEKRYHTYKLQLKLF